MANSSSGTQATPPFQLRPNKFVDRMLFLDLMSREYRKPRGPELRIRFYGGKVPS